MHREFWRGKKVFLTGHTGFKGAWASLWLHNMGAEVFGYSLDAPTQPSLFQEAKVGSLIRSKIGDICDYKTLSKALHEAKPDIVLHMAAQALVRYSYDAPIETYATNVMGTVHILEAIRTIPSVKSVVIVTTDKCYENFEREAGYREDEAMGGYDPYSSSKGCAELVVAAMRRSYFQRNSEAKVASARAGNVIGGGDWAKDRLVPDMMKQFAVGEPVLIRNPNAIRPWQHVLEPVSGYLTLAEKLYDKGTSYAEGWNFGPLESEARNVRYIADRLVKLWGEGSQWITDSKDHPHEATYLKLNIDKAMTKLHWTPRLDIDRTLELTCEWYKEFYVKKAKAYDLTIQQISQFEASK